MTLAAARSFEDLRSLVLRDHALELQQQLILCCRRLRRLDEDGFDPVASKFLDQQDLVGVLPAQAIGCIDQHGVELPFRCQIADALKPWAHQAGAAIALVFEDPILRHAVAAVPCEVDHRRRLAGNRVLFPLLVRGHARVDRRDRHRFPPLPRISRRRPGHGRGQGSRTPAEAWPRASDQTNSRDEPDADPAVTTGQPCLWAAARKAVSARATISPCVTPLAAE